MLKLVVLCLVAASLALPLSPKFHGVYSITGPNAGPSNNNVWNVAAVNPEDFSVQTEYAQFSTSTDLNAIVAVTGCPYGGKLFLLMSVDDSETKPNHFVTVDLMTGATTFTPQLSLITDTLFFQIRTGTVYTYSHSENVGLMHAIDKSTGVFTTIAKTEIIPEGVAHRIPGYDAVSDTVHFFLFNEDHTGAILTVDVADHTSNFVKLQSSSVDYYDMVVNNGQVYTIMKSADSSNMTINHVNLSTGELTTTGDIGEVIGEPKIGAALATSQNDFYFFTNEGSALDVVHTNAQGVVMSDKAAAQPPAAFCMI